MLAGWVLPLAGDDRDGHILVRMDPVSHKDLAADPHTLRVGRVQLLVNPLCHKYFRRFNAFPAISASQ